MLRGAWNGDPRDWHTERERERERVRPSERERESYRRVLSTPKARLMAPRVASRCYNRWNWNRGCCLCCIPQQRGGFCLLLCLCRWLCHFRLPATPRPHSHPVSSRVCWHWHWHCTIGGIGHGILGASCSGFLQHHLGRPGPGLPLHAVASMKSKQVWHSSSLAGEEWRDNRWHWIHIVQRVLRYLGSRIVI